MTLASELVLLVLVAALAHATWNALVKTADDKLSAMAMTLGTGALIGALALPFVAIPAAAAWPYLVASVVLHNAYFALVVLAYRAGDLSLVYPLARGSAPAVVAILAAAVVGETLGPWGWTGILLSSAGIMALAATGWRSGGAAFKSIGLALATGLMVAAYTVTDGIGMRRSGAPFGYIAWAFLIWGVVFAMIALALERRNVVVALRRSWRSGAASGGLAVIAYGIVLYALALGPMAHVSALRETSVLFAALIGAIRLKEPFGPGRIGAAAVIVAGLVILEFRS